jgi:hypothetical protein
MILVSRLLLTLASLAAMRYMLGSTPEGPGRALDGRFWATAALWLVVFGAFVWSAAQIGELWGRAAVVLILVFAAHRGVLRQRS